MLYIRGDFHVCPNPLSADTYPDCLYNCQYCFVKTTPKFMKPKPDKNMFKAMLDSLPRYEKLKDKLPVIVARKSEALHPKIASESIRYMETLRNYGFKVILETKQVINPDKLSEAVDGVFVSLLPGSESLISKLEPNLPSPDKRFNFAKELIDIGKWVGFITEPLLPSVDTDEKLLDEHLRKVANTGAKIVNFGAIRVNNAKAIYQNFKNIGLDLLKVIQTQKEKWIDIGLRFFEIGHKYGLKVTSPDWINFGFINDTEGCCGLDEFGVHHMTFHYALRVLKKKHKVTFDEIAKNNLFGKSHLKKFRERWNGDKNHYTLDDVEEVYSCGVDENGNEIYCLKGEK